jgi:hypothetical protein
VSRPSHWILIPVMFPAVAYKKASHLFDLL